MGRGLQVGHGELLMGLQSSHFLKFYYKTVYFYYNAAFGLIKYVDFKVNGPRNAFNEAWWSSSKIVGLQASYGENH